MFATCYLAILTAGVTTKSTRSFVFHSTHVIGQCAVYCSQHELYKRSRWTFVAGFLSSPWYGQPLTSKMFRTIGKHCGQRMAGNVHPQLSADKSHEIRPLFLFVQLKHARFANWFLYIQSLEPKTLDWLVGSSAVWISILCAQVAHMNDPYVVVVLFF